MGERRPLESCREAWRRIEVLRESGVPARAATLDSRTTFTTADLLEAAGHLAPDLRRALDTLAEGVAMAISGASDEDVAQVRAARLLWVEIERTVPEELRDVLDQLLEEETGLVQGRAQSLQCFGRELGWRQSRQAAAAGGALAVAAVAVVAHALAYRFARKLDA